MDGKPVLVCSHVLVLLFLDRRRIRIMSSANIGAAPRYFEGLSPTIPLGEWRVYIKLSTAALDSRLLSSVCSLACPARAWCCHRGRRGEDAAGMSLTPLQRSNFRGVAPAQGGASSPASGQSGKFRSEFPAKARKRLQVGTTNLSKSASTLAILSRSGSPDPKKPVEDPAAAAPYLSETNIELMKALMAWTGSPVAPLSTQDASLVVHSAQRRRQTGGQPAFGGKQLPLGPLQSTTEAPAISTGDENATPDRAPDHPEGRLAPATISGDKVLETVRLRLRDAFMDKYGSMRAVFRAFDSDANGMISAQRFYDMVEAAEVDLTAGQVRDLYRSADANGDNTMAFQEFLQLFAREEAPSDSVYSPLRQPADLVADPSSSLALKYRTPLELSPRSRRRMKQLRVQVTEELTKKHGEALSVQGGKHDLLLAYAFKNLDSDNDGFLSYDQVERALGSDYLQLGIPASDMTEMLHLMDRNSDRKISMREFVHYFAAGAREPPTDLLVSARKKVLASLHAKRTAQLTPRDEFAPRPAPIERVAEEPSDPPPPKGCMQEQLVRRTAASLVAADAFDGQRRHLGSSASVPTLRPSTTPMGSTRLSSHDAGASLSGSEAPLKLSSTRANWRSLASLTLGDTDDGRAALSTAPATQDRFWRRRLERTDWSRVGVGGDGTRADCALFADASDRFSTTVAAAHSPITRAFPSAVAETGGVSPDGRSVSVAVSKGGVLLVRDGRSTATSEHEAREARRAARMQRTNGHLESMAAARAKEERLREWTARARVRRTAGERFEYLDRLQEAEARLAAREMHMQRRHGGVAFLRMWAGSADSQFNASS